MHKHDADNITSTILRMQVDASLQDGRLQGIAVMANWSLQNWKVLVDDNVI